MHFETKARFEQRLQHGIQLFLRRAIGHAGFDIKGLMGRPGRADTWVQALYRGAYRRRSLYGDQARVRRFKIVPQFFDDQLRLKFPHYIFSNQWREFLKTHAHFYEDGLNRTRQAPDSR